MCQTVHGGLIMSLTDTLGSLAIASKGHFMTGVSTDIGTSFVKPAGIVGDTLYGIAVVTTIGKSLAYTRVDFTNDKGTLVAYGSMSSCPVRHKSTSRNLFDRTQATQNISANHRITRFVCQVFRSSLSWLSTRLLQDNVEFTEDGEELIGTSA